LTEACADSAQRRETALRLSQAARETVAYFQQLGDYLEPGLAPRLCQFSRDCLRAGQVLSEFAQRRAQVRVQSVRGSALQLSLAR
jgi:hypothetical protein